MISCFVVFTELSRLSRNDRREIRKAVHPHVSKWRLIGQSLGFSSRELDNIESKPRLFIGAPYSYLDDMLEEWHQWIPGDARGSDECASRKSMRIAMTDVGLGLAACEL